REDSAGRLDRVSTIESESLARPPSAAKRRQRVAGGDAKRAPGNERETQSPEWGDRPTGSGHLPLDLDLDFVAAPARSVHFERTRGDQAQRLVANLDLPDIE